LWNASGAELTTLTGHTDTVCATSFSPDGAHILSASYDGTLKLWDATTGTLITTFAGHRNLVTACAFSPDGTRILSASWDRTLKVWDVYTGEEVTTLTSEAEGVPARTLASDASRILSGAGDLWDRLWDAAISTRWVESCAFSPDGTRIISAYRSGPLKVWDAATGAEIATLRGHTDAARTCAFSPDGSLIVSASWDKTLRLWDAAAGALICEYRAGGSVHTVAWEPRGSRLAAGDAGGQLHILQLENVPIGPPVVTPWRAPGDVFCALGCLLCRGWSEAPPSALGSELPCPRCGERVRLNPFTINAAWRPVAAAWRRRE
jgi:WD40 repeat protein